MHATQSEFMECLDVEKAAQKVHVVVLMANAGRQHGYHCLVVTVTDSPQPPPARPPQSHHDDNQEQLLDCDHGSWNQECLHDGSVGEERRTLASGQGGDDANHQSNLQRRCSTSINRHGMAWIRWCAWRAEDPDSKLISRRRNE